MLSGVTQNTELLRQGPNPLLERSGLLRIPAPHLIGTIERFTRRTELGRQQVRDAVREHMAGIHVDATLFSGIARAKEAAEVAVQVLVRNDLVPGVELGFGFAEPDPAYPYLRVEQQVLTCGMPETAVLWREMAPRFRKMRDIVQAMLRLQAVYHAGKASPNGNERHILVLTHNPTAIIGAIDPEITPGLRYADICRYVLEVDPFGGATLLSSEVLRAPYE